MGTLNLLAELKSPVNVQILLENGKNKPWDKLIFAVAPDGTDSMDQKYDEYEIPNWPFPSGVFTAVFMTYNEKEQQDIWSYKCVYGPHPDSTKFFKKFRFRVFYGASSYVTMKWSKLPNFIDSAVISDKLNGLYFKVNMKDTLQKTNYENLIDEFEVYVHYNVDPNSINFLDLDNKYVNIYPNPAKDYIVLTSSIEIKNIVIFDSYGNELLIKDTYNGDPINISKLNTGIYFLRLSSDSENTYIKKLIINR